MYRLSTLTSFYITRIQMLSKQKYRSAKQIQPSEQTCTFCKQISHALPLKVMGLTRSLSTTPSTAPIRAIRKKRKSRKAKQYTELLEVTGLTSNDTTASVKQLKAKHLTQFVDGNVDVRKPKKVLKDKANIVPSPVTDLFGPVHCSDVATQEQLITFDHLQSFEDFPIIFFNDKFTISTDSVALLKEIRDSYSKFRDSSVIDRLEEFENELPEVFEDLKSTRIPEELLEEIDLNTLEHLESIDQTLLEPSVSEEQTLPKQKSKMLKVTSKKNVRNQMEKRKQDLLDKTAKEESISKNLYAYLDLCVASNLLNRGLATLTYYRTRGHASNRHNSFPRIVDRNLYNILLHGFAGKGNLEKVQEILSNLREERIPWNEQTFAAVLECLGRNPPSPENNKQIAKYRSEAKSKGFSLNRIVDRSKFTADQRETVISAIRRLEPEFTPVYTPPPLLYNCDLVSELNRNIPLANDLNTNRFETDSNSLYTNHEFIFHPQELKNVAKEQLKIELEGVVKVKSIEKKSKEMVLHYRKKLEELESSWRDTICSAFRRDLNSLKAQHSSLKVLKAISLYPYLNVLEVPQYADIIMREVRRLSEGSESFSPTVKQLYRELGSRVQARYQIELRQKNGVLDKVGDIYFKYCDGTSDFYSKLNKFQRKSEKDILATNNARQRWQVLVHQHNYGPSVDVEERVWPQAVLLGVGQFLYNILMRDLKVDVNCVKFNSKQQNMLPAFYTLFRSQGRIVKEEVKPHPIIAKLQRGCQQELLSFEPNMVPMLCPPVPWTSITSGGYIIAKTDIMRMPTQAVQQWHTLKATTVDQLYPPLDCLNQLGSIPWRVNQPVLDVILEVFNAGGSDKLEVPRPPSSLPSPAPVAASATKTERFQAYRNRISFKRRQGEMYSLWCDALYKLSLANHLRDRIFWLPHNMDFRGRVYPCPPHLNHLGSDLARSMLMFGTGKPLGSNGLEWLKLHCVNLTGTMKRQSVNERLLYAEEIMSDILDSADNPLHGRRWWTESDEPWQTLACCKEIAKACRSPNPEEYISCFPVHQDGSCNGLQHYAALGRDSAGAFSVNLTPAKSPQDVYSAVASLVESARIRDSENGIRVAQVLEGYVRRKVIKQTVMTTVYGVTRYGARLQIARQLKDIDNFPKDFVWAASSYLTARTFESLREMFTSTKEIQDWFTECARLISAVCGQNVEWVTPLGLPVVQPYHRFRKLDGSKTKMPEHFTMDMFERPNVMKQKNAFPPNFIHSLDSCHMMLTSLFCERAGITFVSVHDCFWTHPCDVHIMNKVCREQFVALHSLPILENLSIFLQNKFSYNEESFANDGSVIDLTKRKLNRIFLQLPSTGDFDLNNVLKSTYFFS